MSRWHLTAQALHRRANRLPWAAEVIADYEPYRDVNCERNRLREAAGHADQRATIAERLVSGPGPPKRRRWT
jgi:hypothetical protein